MSTDLNLVSHGSATATSRGGASALQRAPFSAAPSMMVFEDVVGEHVA